MANITAAGRKEETHCTTALGLTAKPSERISDSTCPRAYPDYWHAAREPITLIGTPSFTAIPTHNTWRGTLFILWLVARGSWIVDTTTTFAIPDHLNDSNLFRCCILYPLNSNFFYYPLGLLLWRSALAYLHHRFSTTAFPSFSGLQAALVQRGHNFRANEPSSSGAFRINCPFDTRSAK